MIEMDRIRSLSNRIAKEFKPQRIVLFGSHAYGAPRDDSDVDLLIVMPFKGSGLRKALEIIRAMKPQFSLDLIVRRPQEVEFRLANNDWFLREVFEQGRTLYESSDARVGGKGRR
jgi:predicted nucleotidyltransferase